ncbi:MAG: helix-turn-helix transcriptional regulator [Gammaproteobacteria bacterium]
MGARIASIRLDRNLTQQELAEEAGVSSRTLARAEAGESVQLLNLIRLLRALNLLQNTETLIPDTTTSPLRLHQLQTPKRQRASKRKTATQPAPATDASGPAQGWTWEDEQ